MMIYLSRRNKNDVDNEFRANNDNSIDAKGIEKNKYIGIKKYTEKE